MSVARRGAGVRRRAWVLALAVVASACGTRDGSSTDSARTAAADSASRAVASEAPDRGKPACPKTGHWADCHVRERLVRSGFAPRDTTHAELPALGPTPAVLRLGKGALAVYLFADSAARARAATTLDTVKFVRAPRGPTVLSQATAIENDNLLALLFSKNEQQIERVSDALTAGPPQP